MNNGKGEPSQMCTNGKYTSQASIAPDVYFTEEYGRAEEARGSGQWLDIQALDGKWRLPVHLRGSDGLVDAVSPYGYAGLYVHPAVSAVEHKRSWEYATRVLRDHDVLTVFLRQSPLLAAPMPVPGARLVVDSHLTVCVDTEDSTLAWDRMEGRSRTSVRKAERLGLGFRIRQASVGDVAPDSDFRVLYEGAMRRRDAKEGYYFPDAYYEALSTGLGPNLLLATVSDASGTTVAAALLMRHSSTLHYHLSGTGSAAASSGATNLLLWGAIEWATRHGIDRFHLGGGVSNGDSLFKFKRSFGGEVLSYSTYGLVLDSDGFDRAVAQRALQLQRPIIELLNDGFFPPFRIS